MKILIIGFLAFIGWSAFSDYIYVCKIRGYCVDAPNAKVADLNKKSAVSVDSVLLPSAREVAVNPGNLVLYFDFDKSELNSVSVADKYFEKSVNYLDQNAEAKFSIIGYADATGSVMYNQALGMRRAITVQNYFISKGIQAARFTIQSRGENDPVADNSTETGRSKNRRTELTINK
jgi:outer membrane protein OmpA-like peptidoglycan-associated protein